MKGRNYRIPSGMPLTQKRFKPGAPNPKIARFTLGKSRPDYDVKVQLVSTERTQIRHNALEAARVAANKKLITVGEENYFLMVKVYPHVILRENKMIATAGADRLQEGMRKAFGKAVGLAARVKPGSVILEISTSQQHATKARESLKTASTKLPMPTYVVQVPLTPAAPQA
ncbi:MAG: 50S ribosomal protein L16 [Thaumarchaeota archaeon]|nr:50S ribosomal protein L16 [Nitrososphaerota archaeon]